MHVFIDEAGTFSKSNTAGSYCVIGAIAMPESSLKKACSLLSKLKLDSGFRPDQEVKARDLSELTYRQWMCAFAKLDMIGIAAATDSSFNSTVSAHKERQALKIEEAASKMLHPEGRDYVQGLATQLRRTSDQNYAELMVRVLLVKDAMELASMYYSQRKPGALAKFKWKFDGKELKENNFESTLRNIAPVLMQSAALEEPFFKISGGNYSRFDESFSFNGDVTWLPSPETHRGAPGGVSHIGRMWHSELAFVRSNEHPGVQIADLFTSGIRRALRAAWKDNEAVSMDIGRLMVSRAKHIRGIRMVVLDPVAQDQKIEPHASRAINAMRKTSRPLIVNSARKTGPHPSSP